MGIVLFSKVVVFCLSRYYVYTVSLFIGLICGGISDVFRDVSVCVKNIVLAIVSFLVVSGLSLFSLNNFYIIQHSYFDGIVFFLSGILEALGMVLPGVSSTALLMLIGIYPYYVMVISHLFDCGSIRENLSFLVPFLLGLGFGIIFISLLIDYLFKNYREEIFSIIFGFSFSSIFLLVVRLIFFVDFWVSFLGVVLFIVIGYFISCCL